MQVEHEVGVTSAATPQQVWDVMTDWERQGEWMPQTRVWLTGGPRGGVGERFTARTGIGPLAFDDTIVVLERDEPYRCLVEHTGRVVRGLGEFRLAEQVPGDPASGTHVRWWEQVEIPGGPVAPALWTVARRPLEAVFGVALRRLARLVEAEAGRGER